MNWKNISNEKKMIVNVNYNNTLAINLPKDCFHRYIKGRQTIY
jgi:hypothetical protein